MIPKFTDFAFMVYETVARLIDILYAAFPSEAHFTHWETKVELSLVLDHIHNDVSKKVHEPLVYFMAVMGDIFTSGAGNYL